MADDFVFHGRRGIAKSFGFPDLPALSMAFFGGLVDSMLLPVRFGGGLSVPSTALMLSRWLDDGAVRRVWGGSVDTGLSVYARFDRTVTRTVMADEDGFLAAAGFLGRVLPARTTCRVQAVSGAWAARVLAGDGSDKAREACVVCPPHAGVLYGLDEVFADVAGPGFGKTEYGLFVSGRAG